MNFSGVRLERAIVALGIFLAPMATLRFDAFFFTASDFLLCVSLTMLLIFGRLPQAPLGPTTIVWIVGAALLLLGLLGSSLLRGLDPARALVVVAQYLFAYVLLLWVIAGRQLHDAEMLTKAFVLGVAAICVHGILIFYTIGYTPESIVVSGRRRLNTVLGDANLAASIVSLCLPLLLYLWMQGRIRAWLAVPLLGVFATTVVLTGSFSGLALASFSIALFLIVTMSRVIFVRLVLVMAAGAAILMAGGDQYLPEAFRERVLSALVEGDIKHAGTFGARLDLIHEAVAVIRDRGVLLVGLGADQFRAISEHRAPVHNLYLLLWAEGGVLALLGWCLMLLTIILLAVAARLSGAPSALAAQAVATTFILLLGANATAHLYARFWILPSLLSVALLMAGLGRQFSRPRGAVPMLRPWGPAVAAVAFGVLLSGPANAIAQPHGDTLVRALRSAVGFMRDEVAPLGGYAWTYKADLSERRGEGGRILPMQGWVQPPGIPSVGTAFLQAWDATGDTYYLDGAHDAATMLERTQLRSGGWWYLAEFDPVRAMQWCYRMLGHCKDREETWDNENRNASTLDDNTTLSSIAFLIRVDYRLGGADRRLRDAVDYGLERLIDEQYENGAWPTRFDYRPSEGPGTATRASFPETGVAHAPRIPINGKRIYTTNDHLMRDTIRVLLFAHRTYGTPELLQAAERAGQFLVAAQMPDPQPGWAQHYDRDMHPMWGRKFEPPAVASRETAGVMEALMDLWAYTGDARWLEPVPAAAAWLRRSRLADGRWSRFYELTTNRPLYMTTSYDLTYDDSDLPTHYGFRSDLDIPEALARWDRVAAGASDDPHWADRNGEAYPETVTEQANEAIASLDLQGRWVDPDGRIRSATFVSNINYLTNALGVLVGRPVVAGRLECEIRPETATSASCRPSSLAHHATMSVDNPAGRVPE